MLALFALLACQPEVTSLEWESCAYTAQCAEGLRCVAQTCRAEEDARTAIDALSASTEESPSLVGIYKLDQRPTNPNSRAVLSTIEVTGTETIATFTTSGTGRVNVFPPSHKQAMRLVDARTGEIYRLFDVDGVSLDPEWTHFQADEPLTFTAIFDRIPDGMDRLHLIEGELELQNGVPWHFMNVRLTPEHRYSEAADVPAP